jgi:hypothetical protein
MRVMSWKLRLAGDRGLPSPANRAGKLPQVPRPIKPAAGAAWMTEFPQNREINRECEEFRPSGRFVVSIHAAIPVYYTEFPTELNREFLFSEQGFFGRNREKQGMRLWIDFSRVQRIQEGAKLLDPRGADRPTKNFASFDKLSGAQTHR